MYMNNIKGITYFEEDREPTPDSPNNIISIGVDERVANYIDRLERKLEEKDKEIERLNNIIKEVREYIDNDFNRFNCFGSMAVSMEMNYKREELLEILDKGV